MIKQASLEIIYSMETRKYLEEETSRVAVLSGIGSEYFPKLDLLENYKKLIFVENESDKKILEILGKTCNIPLIDDIVYWTNTETHAIRRKIFENLKTIIPDLKCISLRDRDSDEKNTIGQKLDYKGIHNPENSDILLLEWRRRNIESYLLCPKAIADASCKSTDDVKKHIQDNFALAINDDGFTKIDPPDPILQCDGKNIFIKEKIGIEKVFHCNKYDVAKKMTVEQVPEDIKIFLGRVGTFFAV